MTRRALIGWLLIGLAGFTLIGSDSNCSFEADDDEFEVDFDDDDDFDFGDIFDKAF